LTALSFDLAIDRALKGLDSRPYLAQLYAVYLSRFVSGNDALVDAIMNLVGQSNVGAYERMLLLAALQSCSDLASRHIRTILGLMQDRRQPEPVRALSAILGLKFGSAQQQRAVKARYEEEQSPFMRSALLYGAKWLSKGDRNTCKRVWGAHSMVNGILASTI
jgi:hypothetical protein